MRSLALTLSLLSAYAAATKIVIADDDGWATAQIRQQFDTLTSAGHDVSSPYSGLWGMLARDARVIRGQIIRFAAGGGD